MSTPPASLWWSGLSEPPTARAPLTHDLDCDVAIVGGGYSGLWTARELLRRDPALHVVVLEASLCGFGASGRNGGWASALYPLGHDEVSARHGVSAADHLRVTLRRAVAALGAAASDDGLDIQFAHGGTVTVARTDAQIARLHAAQNDEGANSNVQWLEGRELTDRIRIAGATAGLFTPYCAALHPARLVRGLATVIERLGARIVENSPVLRILPGHNGRRPCAVTAAGTVRADVVVRASEGYTPRLPGLRRRIAPLYSLMIATEPLPQSFWDVAGLSNRETFNDERHLIIYGQRTADDRLAFGGRGARYHFGSTVESRFDRDNTVFARLESTLHELFPHLRGAVTHRWGGPLALSRDRSPFVNVDRRTGLAELGGYLGDGVVLSRVAATAMAESILQPDQPGEFSSLCFVGHQGRQWELEPARYLGINGGLLLADRADRDERERRNGRSARWLERLLG